jgi:hypothetical protein
MEAAVARDSACEELGQRRGRHDDVTGRRGLARVRAAAGPGRVFGGKGERSRASQSQPRQDRPGKRRASRRSLSGRLFVLEPGHRNRLARLKGDLPLLEP